MISKHWQWKGDLYCIDPRNCNDSAPSFLPCWPACQAPWREHAAPPQTSSVQLTASLGGLWQPLQPQTHVSHAGLMLTQDETDTCNLKQVLNALAQPQCVERTSADPKMHWHAMRADAMLPKALLLSNTQKCSETLRKGKPKLTFRLHQPTHPYLLQQSCAR